MISLDTALIVGSVIAMNSLVAGVIIAFGLDGIKTINKLKEYHLENKNANKDILNINKKLLKFFTNDFAHWLERNDKK